MTEQIIKPRPILHLLLEGESGVGKDTFAATWPKPMLVWHLDGYGQEMPYMKGAEQVGELASYQLGNSDIYIQYRDIVKAGEWIRVEYFGSDNPEMPDASRVLSARMSYFPGELQQLGYRTLVCGSLSSIALEGRLYEQFVLNPQYKDPRKWYGAATEYVERVIMMQRALPCNVVFICHIGKTMDEVAGEMLYTPDLPGRLSYSAARYFNEMYRMFVKPNEQGQRVRYLQTDNDGRFQSKTHIDAPAYIDNPNYEKLWSGWK